MKSRVFVLLSIAILVTGGCRSQEVTLAPDAEELDAVEDLPDVTEEDTRGEDVASALCELDCSDAPEATGDLGDCARACEGRECGPDPLGCGIDCGGCGDDRVCDAGACRCPDETWACGEECCDDGVVCVDGQHCCRPDCGSRVCGSDGCGGSCGLCSIDGEVCTEEGACERLQCGATVCPEHPTAGWSVTCNAQGFCEYARTDGRRHADEIYLPPGSFTMGLPEGACPFDPEDELSFLCARAQPAHLVTFSRGFFLGKYEVTLGAYRECVTVGVCRKFRASGDCWHSWDDEGENVYLFDVLSDEHPAICVDIEGAREYCAWIGGRLPSEAEWEYALRVDSEALYLWSEPPGDKLCEEFNCCRCHDHAVPVGTMRGDLSHSGARDMLGNVAEYTSDCWVSSYEGAPGDGAPWTQGCEEWSMDGRYVRRGGAPRSPVKALVTFLRSHTDGFGADYMGFRCARNETVAAPGPQAR